MTPPLNDIMLDVLPPAARAGYEDHTGRLPAYTIPGSRRNRIWIDIDNSPHVPFFVPIIEELAKLEIELMLTARNMYQVCELLEFYRLPCTVVGGHYGKNILLKVLCNSIRACQLFPTAARWRPDIAISHGSRAQVLICKAMGIPTVMMHDYEHSVKTGFLESDWILVPEVIPTRAMSRNGNRVLKYPGIKEDVYVPRLRPDPSIRRILGVSAHDVLVTIRPPATEAHYHHPDTDMLFAETLRFLAREPSVRMVVLPRNTRQDRQLRKDWASLIASRQMVIPETAVDGLNLIWFSDLVISGGGTMNREAAALGVPVYSIFRGRLGAVDRYLADQKRMTLIQSISEIESKIVIDRWNRPDQPETHNSAALQTIIYSVLQLLESPESAAYPTVVGRTGMTEEKPAFVELRRNI